MRPQPTEIGGWLFEDQTTGYSGRTAAAAWSWDTHSRPLEIHNRILRIRTSQKQNSFLIKKHVARQYQFINTVDIKDQWCQLLTASIYWRVAIFWLRGSLYFLLENVARRVKICQRHNICRKKWNVALRYLQLSPAQSLLVDEISSDSVVFQGAAIWSVFWRYMSFCDHVWSPGDLNQGLEPLTLRPGVGTLTTVSMTVWKECKK